jgi:hypothetical protein
LQLFPRKKIIQENQGNETHSVELSKPNTWRRRENQRSRGRRRAKQGMDALHENILQEESGIFEIRYVEWTKEAVFGFKRSRKSKLSESESKTGCSSSLVSENGLGIRFAEKSTSDEREKRKHRDTEREGEEGETEKGSWECGRHALAVTWPCLRTEISLRDPGVHTVGCHLRGIDGQYMSRRNERRVLTSRRTQP